MGERRGSEGRRGGKRRAKGWEVKGEGMEREGRRDGK